MGERLATIDMGRKVGGGLLYQRCADPEMFVRISPRIPTTDPRPRPRPQADALWDPLSVRESATRFLILTYV